VLGSLRDAPDIIASPLALPTDPDVDSYEAAWNGGNPTSLGRGLWNSVIITGGSVILLIALGSIAAYAIARRPGKMSAALYGAFVLGIILPTQLGVVPTYVALRHLGLLGSYLGMILLYVGLLMPLAVFLYTGFVFALPKEYEEAAQVDRAGLVRTFVRVVFPLLGPVTGTVAILTGLIIWNDFFNPLIFLSGTDKSTMPVALYSLVGELFSQWDQIFAAVIISILPVLVFFLFVQRQLIRGFTGGIKS
jgi:raffinose/stachyose/melibiose transport system permease protein